MFVFGSIFECLWKISSLTSQCKAGAYYKYACVNMVHSDDKGRGINGRVCLFFIQVGLKCNVSFECCMSLFKNLQQYCLDYADWEYIYVIILNYFFDK